MLFGRWMKYFKKTIKVESLKLSFFHDDNKGMNVFLLWQTFSSSSRSEYFFMFLFAYEY